MHEASRVDRLSTARGVIDLQLDQIRICTSSTSRFRVVHDDRRTLYVRMRPNREVLCCPSAGFGDSLGDWSGRNESGENRASESAEKELSEHLKKNLTSTDNLQMQTKWVFNGYCR